MEENKGGMAIHLTVMPTANTAPTVADDLPKPAANQGTTLRVQIQHSGAVP